MPDESSFESDKLIGRKLGEFILKEKLGEGGFGTVYSAEQATLSREAVIKVLRTRHLNDAEKIERFKREAKLASRLEHPYTAHIYAFGVEEDGLLWIAMELIRGTTLDQLLKVQGALPLERFVPLLEKICEVVHTAHEYGIIHRDIKPSNVMVISRAGQLLPKLLDFGIAKGFDRPSPKPVISLNKSEINVSPDVATQSINQVLDKNPITHQQPIFKQTDDGNFIDTEEQVNKTASANSLTSQLTLTLENATLAKLNAQNTLDKLAAAISQDFQTVGIIGSPPYMSPEQWSDTSLVCAQSDIYSLGVLSYEVLTGDRPFVETSHLDMALAHLTKPVPPLGKDFPALLDQVITKAMAKQPSERYSTALELAAAFRKASGVKEKQTVLPQIDKEIQESFLANAPQPIAQTIANLVAAKNLHQLREELLDLFSGLVRYLALLALACRTQIGSSGLESQEIEAISLLRKLHQHDLNQEEWLKLTKEVCRPFVKHRDAFPIPELVSLFFTLDNLTNNQIYSLFEPFLSAQDLSKRGIDSDEGTEILNVKMAQMTGLLSALSFLQDYHLVIPRKDYTEQRIGLHFRSSEALNLKSFSLDQPVITDSNAHPIVKLWPLVKVAPPFPSATDEIFLFAGQGRYSGRFVSFPSGFELQDDEIWQWISKNIFDLGSTNPSLNSVEQTPYLGLRSFTNSDVGLFYGREKETSTFLNRMCNQALLAVVGPSGAGKSSFIQAGIIPALSNEWLTITVRPGSIPLVTLITQLTKLGLKEIPSVENIKAKPECLGEALRKWMIEVDKKLLLVIDQLEELFSLCLDIEEREKFSTALAELARSAEEPIRLVVTLRDDFLIRTQQLPGLKNQLSNGLYLLATPDKEDLLRILVKPAQQAGYEFEDAQLPQEIVNEVAQQPAALALLAFTGSKLWELRDRQFKQLRRKAYQAMGGVGGALAQHAEEMMAQMATEEQGLVREVMRRLVTSEKTRAVVTRPELVHVLEKQSTETVLEKLVASRLLTAYEGDDGVERIEIAHEALLSAWPRLVKWQQEMAEGTRLLDQLQIAARQWDSRKRPKGLLWRDEALTEYQLWQSRYKIKLTETEKAFADASLAESQRITLRNRILISSIITILLVGSTVLFWQRSRIETQLLNFYQERGREELLKENNDRALLYLTQGYKLGNKNYSLRFMLTQALNQLENKEPQLLQGHKSWVKALSFSPDSKKLATASSDNSVIIWEVESGKILNTLLGHKASVNSLAFSPDGERLITASNDQTIKIWRVDSGQLLDSVDFDSVINYVVFSPNGNHFAVASYGAKVFDINTKQLIFSLDGHNGSINTIAYSPDGKKILTASQDATAKIWQAENGKLLATLLLHQDSLTSASFSSNNKYIITTSNDHSLKIWQADNTKLLTNLDADPQQVYFGDITSDSEKVVTVGHDQMAKIWEVTSGKQIYAFKGHTSIVRMAKFSPDGKYLATASADHSVRLWNITLDTRPAEVVSQIVKDKIPLKLEQERIEPISNNVASNPLPKEIIKPTALKIDFSNLKKFSFQTVTIDKTGNITSRRSSEASFYREQLSNEVFFDMVSINGGSFIMGAPEGQGAVEEYPQHQVSVRSFFIGKTEVTQALWQAVMGSNPAYSKGENLPVDSISWYEAMLFCERLSQITGRNYRLPSEAEWEFAARANTITPFSFGENISPEFVNYDGSAPFNNAPKGVYRQKTVAVASLGFANNFGLYDMHGNVYEWCLDTGSDNYKDAPTDGYARETPYSNSRVLRGGSWYYPASDARTTARASVNPTGKLKSVGLRLVYQP